MVQELPDDDSRADRILSFHYLICMLLPVLKQIDQEQSIELELEAKVKGPSTKHLVFVTHTFYCLTHCFGFTGLEISELQIKHDEHGSKPSKWYAILSA